MSTVKNALIETAIKMGLNYLESDPEKNIPKLMDLVDKTVPKNVYPNERKRIRKAIEDKAFVLEADQVMFKYGTTAFVSSNTNFVAVKGDEAVVQVAFNVPVSGPNGIGGVTVSGSISGYKKEVDKKGTIRISMNVMGTGISAQVDITLPEGGNRATVHIMPTFNSNRFTLSGNVLPMSKANVYQGRTL